MNEPDEQPQRAWRLQSMLAFSTAFAVALIAYVFTLAPTVSLVDSGELIVASASLGVAHPPGFPIYVLLSHPFTLLPFGDLAHRVNLASAFFAALAAGMMALAVIELLRSPRAGRVALPASKGARFQPKKKKKEAEALPADASLDNSVIALIGLVSGLLLAFSRTVWAYATVAEVYTLNTLLVVTILTLMLRWRRHSMAAPGSDRLLFLAAFLFGIALGDHHVTVGLWLPALAVLVLSAAGVSFFASRRFWIAAGVSLAGLFLIYSYLPLAAGRHPIMNWGNPINLQRVWWHITGKQYQAFLQYSSAGIGTQLEEFFSLLFRELGPVWMPAALLVALYGLFTLFRRDRAIFFFLIAAMAANLIYASGYDIAEDKNAYYLPTFVALIFAVAAGAAEFTRRFQRPMVLAAVMLVLPVIALASNFRQSNRRDFLVAHDYVQNVLDSAAPGSLILTMEWQLYSPMLYHLDALQERPDLEVVDFNLLRRSWYFDYLGRRYPELMSGIRPQLEAFLPLLNRWEQEPEVFARDGELTKRINDRLNDVTKAMVSTHLTRGNVYMTYELPLSPDPSMTDLTGALTRQYQYVPEGLLLRLTPVRALQPMREVAVETRGLTDRSAYDESDVVLTKVIPAYENLFLFRGRYAKALGEGEKAKGFFNDALRLNPSSVGAQEELAKLK